MAQCMVLLDAQQTNEGLQSQPSFLQGLAALHPRKSPLHLQPQFYILPLLALPDVRSLILG